MTFDPDDISAFRNLSQSSENDRRALLRVQGFVRARREGYRYVEVGSFLGGSLLPHLCDPLCASVLSIDPRPQDPYPDARNAELPAVNLYKGVTSAVMRQFLEPHASPDQMAKLETIDADASAVPLATLGTCDLALIDGEHTDAAVASDVASLLPAMAEDGVIAFHDVNLVAGGIRAALSRLDGEGVPHRLFLLPDVVGILALRGSVEAAAAAFGQG